MQIFATYIIMFLVFVVVEALMLTFFMAPFFSKHIGHLMRPQINLYVTLLYYLLYVAGVFYFCYFSGFKTGSFSIIDPAVPRAYYEEIQKRWKGYSPEIAKGERIPIENAKEIAKSHCILFVFFK